MFSEQGITLNEKLIDDVTYEWIGEDYTISVRFRDGVKVKVRCNQVSEEAVATFSSVAVALTFPLLDSTYDKFLEWLETAGYLDYNQWGI
jgi:hypothetical protein